MIDLFQTNGSSPPVDFLLRPISESAQEHGRSRLHHTQQQSNDPHKCLHCIKYGALCHFSSQGPHGAFEIGTLVIVDKRLVPLNGGAR